MYHPGCALAWSAAKLRQSGVGAGWPDGAWGPGTCASAAQAV